MMRKNHAGEIGRYPNGNWALPSALPVGRALVLLLAGWLFMGGLSLYAEDHGAPVFECVPCGMKLNGEKAWARHEIRAHGAKGCLKCGVLFVDELEDAAHQIVHHHATHCTACDRDFPTNREAIGHLVSIHHLPSCPIHHLVFANDEEAGAHAAQCPAFRSQREKATARHAETR